jgi:hypothetical protein
MYRLRISVNAAPLRVRRLRQAWAVALAVTTMVVCAATPLSRAGESSGSPSAQNAPSPSTPHMTAAEKVHALNEFMRREAGGEKIDPALLKAFIAEQNDNATSGIAIGQKAPAFELKDQNSRTQSLESLMGPKGVLLVFTRSADW